MDDKKMEAEKRAKNLDVFFSAILALESKDECDKFFEDIFTAQELIDIPQRLEAVSYTHLDVYKRQNMCCFQNLPCLAIRIWLGCVVRVRF